MVLIDDTACTANRAMSLSAYDMAKLEALDEIDPVATGTASARSNG